MRQPRQGHSNSWGRGTTPPQRTVSGVQLQVKLKINTTATEKGTLFLKDFPGLKNGLLNRAMFYISKARLTQKKSTELESPWLMTGYTSLTSTPTVQCLVASSNSCTSSSAEEKRGSVSKEIVLPPGSPAGMLYLGLSTPGETQIPGPHPALSPPTDMPPWPPPEARPSLLDEFPGEGLELPSSSGCSQQQVQTLPRQHVAQDPQQPLWRLGVVCVHCLGTQQENKP